ncbi:hypothetical protein Zmor_001145 [Zophobas morio]|uniref:Uncharacterized protein n=1 Tax=Zophobas morio TaxID=2755281 RepID=A0AA38J1F6_9CUCU|nr:hypothetical protein Zmor_001145 [Zophobas morio]
MKHFGHWTGVGGGGCEGSHGWWRPKMLRPEFKRVSMVWGSLEMMGFLGDDPPDFVDFQVYRGGVVNDVHLFDADVNIADYYGEVRRFFGGCWGLFLGFMGPMVTLASEHTL